MNVQSKRISEEFIYDDNIHDTSDERAFNLLLYYLFKNIRSATGNGGYLLLLLFFFFLFKYTKTFSG